MSLYQGRVTRLQSFEEDVFFESGIGLVRREMKSGSLSATLRLWPRRFSENVPEAKDDEADDCGVGAGGL
jgi:hypothetical protein